MYYVYVIESIATNRLYIGQTSNLSQRLKEHNTGESPYTRARGPWKLMGSITCNSRSEVLQLESRLKKWKQKDRVLAYLKKTVIHNGSERPDISHVGKVIRSSRISPTEYSFPPG